MIVKLKDILRCYAVGMGIKETANASKLLGQLKVAKVKNNFEAELKKIERCQMLILDALFLV